MKKILLPVLFVILSCSTGFAEGIITWHSGDNTVMTQPMEPDRDGTVIYTEGYVMDDWTASASISTEYHFWGVWENNIVGTISSISIKIYADNDGSPGDDELWNYVFDNSDYTKAFTVTEYTVTEVTGASSVSALSTESIDSKTIYIVDTTTDNSPCFNQIEGETYWLAMAVETENGSFGFVNSENSFGASALIFENGTVTPINGSMAFIITPVPGSFFLFGTALLGLVKVERKKYLLNTPKVT
nr:hypothetical protein [uncultured Desulfobacter sp.]